MALLLLLLLLLLRRRRDDINDVGVTSLAVHLTARTGQRTAEIDARRVMRHRQMTTFCRRRRRSMRWEYGRTAGHV